MIAGVGGEDSLTGVVFDGVTVDRIACSIDTAEAGDFDLVGVFVVATEGDDSALSNCSRRDATPMLVALGERGVSD